MVGKAWTEKELNILKNNGVLSFEDYKVLGVNRSWLQIRRKLNKLGVKLVNKWSFDDDKLLMSNSDLDYLEKVLGRSRNAILVRAVKLGLKWDHFDSLGNNRKWSKKEDNIILEQYDGSSLVIDNLSKSLDRSRKAIKNRACFLGVSGKSCDLQALFK